MAFPLGALPSNAKIHLLLDDCYNITTVQLLGRAVMNHIFPTSGIFGVSNTNVTQPLLVLDPILNGIVTFYPKQF